MNLKKAKKIVNAYKLACSDGKPPVGDFDWQPSPCGYKQADLNLACRITGTTIAKLQIEAMPKKVEPKKVIAPKPVSKKVAPKKVAPKKAPPKASTPKKAVAPAPTPKAEQKKEVKAEPKSKDISNMFKDKDGNGIPDYKEKKPTKSSSRRKFTKKPDEKK